MKTQDIYVAVGFDCDGDSRAAELDPHSYPRPGIAAANYLAATLGEGPYTMARWVRLTLPAPGEVESYIPVYEVEVLD